MPAGEPAVDQPNFVKILRAAGLKVTHTRLALLKLLARERRHMTADEIAAGLRASGVPADRVTVYRNIERMMRDGLLIATHLPGRAMRVGFCMKPDAAHHHHIVCEVCGRMAEIGGCIVLDHWDQLRERVRQESEFDLTGHTMEYTGICKSCRALGQTSR